MRSGLNSATDANGVVSDGGAAETEPSTRACQAVPSSITISPSSRSNVPSPMSPSRPRSAIVIEPSKSPSMSASIVETW